MSNNAKAAVAGLFVYAALALGIAWLSEHGKSGFVPCQCTRGMP